VRTFPSFRDVPILVVCRDRLTELSQLVTWLETAGYRRIVLVDNASTYEPLLQYLEGTPHVTVRMTENLGHRVVWEGQVLERIGHDDIYVVTDCDVVPDDQCPANAVEHFAGLLLRYGDVDKVGFGLRIDDLPDSYSFKREVQDWESQFWEHEIEHGVYRADIDTTFALYRPGTTYSINRALRTGPPFVARHLPWYADSANLSEEELFYREHMSETVGNWNRDALPPGLRLAIEGRRGGAGSRETSAQLQEVTPAGALGDLEQALDEAEKRLLAEQGRRLAAELELDLVRQSRAYRWMKAAGSLRRRVFGD
jgi:hypothetical protein